MDGTDTSVWHGRLGNAKESNLSRWLVLEGECSSHHHFWGRQVPSAGLSHGFGWRGVLGTTGRKAASL